MAIDEPTNSGAVEPRKDVWVAVLPSSLEGVEFNKGGSTITALKPLLLKVRLEDTVDQVEQRLRRLARISPKLNARLVVTRQAEEEFFPEPNATVQSLGLIPYPSRDSISLKSPSASTESEAAAEAAAEAEKAGDEVSGDEDRQDEGMTVSMESVNEAVEEENQSLISDIQQKLAIASNRASISGNSRALRGVLDEVNKLLVDVSLSIEDASPRSPSSDDLTRPQTRLERALAEVVSTERAYVKSLSTMKKWMDGLLKQGVDEDVVKDLFSNLPSILELNRQLLAKLENEELKGNRADEMTTIFEESCLPYLFYYSEYVQNYEKVSRHGLAEILKNKTHYDDIRAVCGIDSVEPKDIIKKLTDDLIKPVQRIPRYVLLFQKISELIENDGEYTEYTSRKLSALIESLISITKKINKDQKEAERREKAHEIQSKLRGTNLKIVTSNRQFLYELLADRLVEPNTWIPVHLILFNDILIYTYPNAGVEEFLGQFQSDVARLEEVPGVAPGSFRISSLTTIQTLTIKFRSGVDKTFLQKHLDKIHAKLSRQSSRRSVGGVLHSPIVPTEILSSVMPVRDCLAWSDLAVVKECTVTLEGSVLTISRPSSIPGMSRPTTLFLDTCVMHSSIKSLKGTFRSLFKDSKLKAFEIKDSRGPNPSIRLRLFPNTPSECLQWMTRISAVVKEVD